MKIRHLLLLTVVLIILSGCTKPSNENPTETPKSTPTLGLPSINTTRVPDVDTAVRRYLNAWKEDDYATMYSLLTSVSQDAISEEDFSKHYRGVATEAALSGIDYDILSSLILNPDSAQVSYRITLHLSLIHISEPTRPY